MAVTSLKTGPWWQRTQGSILETMLELQAQVDDHALNDQLLKELVMKYVHDERHLRQLNHEKSQFLRMAAHDLRNPLSSITGMCDLMIDAPIDEATQREFLLAIRQVSGQMLELLNDLLDVSLIESGQFALEPETFEFGPLVEERIRIASFAATQKEMEIHSNAVPLGEIEADRARIAQVLDNLLSNAIKYSPPGSTIEVLGERRGEHLRVSVRDQGPGIPLKDQPRLFGHFQRLSPRPTAGEKSTGLGLAIVHRIVTAHGGQIHVESDEGHGSCFHVDLPRTVAGAG